MQRVMACSTVDGPGWQLGRRNEAWASDVREGSRHRAWMEHPTPKGNRCTRDGDGDGDAIFGIASPSGPRRGHLQYCTIPTVSKMIAVQYMDPWRVSGRAHDAVSSQAATPGLAAYCLCGSTNAVCA